MNNNKKQRLYIGNAWLKTTKDGNTQFQSVSFKGGYEKDDIEILVRRKSDQQEMLLDKNVSIAIFPVKEKKSEKGPDFDIIATFDE